MLAKRIIPCLDIKEDKVVKGRQFRDHQILGDILYYAEYYCDQGADELVFYDITASSEMRVVDHKWVTKVARVLDIPFCVAGGIRSIEDAKRILNSGADKISINSPALENPEFISSLVSVFGSQCIVVGIDSFKHDDDYYVYQYTGDPNKIIQSRWRTLDWISEVQKQGAGEIVLNCMNQDGVRRGYDLCQLSFLRGFVNVPLVASGGAGQYEHFYSVFKDSNVDGALAASVFHNKNILIPDLKKYLSLKSIEVRVWHVHRLK